MQLGKKKLIFSCYKKEILCHMKERWFLLFIAVALVLIQSDCHKQKVAVSVPGIRRIQFNEPPLKLGAVNIVTTQLNDPNVLCASGNLRVWEYAGETYRAVWKAETYNYLGVAIGDIDGDGKREIVGLGRCPYSQGADRKEQSYNAYFLEAYKEDASVDWNGRKVWKSTFGDDPDNAVSDDDRWTGGGGIEITLADVDGDRTKEILFISGQWLAVYKYNPLAEDKVRKTPGALKKVAAVRPDIEGHHLCLRSVTVWDLDGDGENEILVSTNVGLPSRWFVELAAPGYVLVYHLRNGVLELMSYLSVDAVLSSIRVGDLDNDGKPELCSLGYKTNGKLNQAFVFIWDEEPNEPSAPLARMDSDLVASHDGHRTSSLWVRHEIPFGKPNEWKPHFSLEAGELDAKHPGDEIVLALSSFLQLTVCYWKGSADLISLHDVFYEDTLSMIVGRVIVADTDGDSKNEIIFAGSRKVGPHSGWYYLEILDGNLKEKWGSSGGEFGELAIISAAVG
jgi:hypothetical protein